jgi:hypothetical protein
MTAAAADKTSAGAPKPARREEFSGFCEELRVGQLSRAKGAVVCRRLWIEMILNHGCRRSGGAVL